MKNLKIKKCGAKIIILGLLLIIIFLIHSRWIYFGENCNGDKFYYHRGVKWNTKNIAEVWVKVIIKNNDTRNFAIYYLIQKGVPVKKALKVHSILTLTRIDVDNQAVIELFPILCDKYGRELGHYVWTSGWHQIQPNTMNEELYKKIIQKHKLLLRKGR